MKVVLSEPDEQHYATVIGTVDFRQFNPDRTGQTGWTKQDAEEMPKHIAY